MLLSCLIVFGFVAFDYYLLEAFSFLKGDKGGMCPGKRVSCVQRAVRNKGRGSCFGDVMYKRRINFLLKETEGFHKQKILRL